MLEKTAPDQQNHLQLHRTASPTPHVLCPAVKEGTGSKLMITAVGTKSQTMVKVSTST